MDIWGVEFWQNSESTALRSNFVNAHLAGPTIDVAKGRILTNAGIARRYDLWRAKPELARAELPHGTRRASHSCIRYQ